MSPPRRERGTGPIRRGASDPCPSSTRPFMNERNRHVWVGGWLVLGLALLAAKPAGAVDRVARPDLGPEPRVPVGQCLSAGGTLLAHERAGRAWEAVGAKETVRSRDLLLALPGTRATLETQPGG